MAKYGNKKIEHDGYKFDSVAEMSRYKELKLLLKAGEITHLELQPKFTVVPKTKGEQAVVYIADFSYVEVGSNNVVVEDVKGMATKEYVIKRKLFKHQNPNIDFREIPVGNIRRLK